MLKIFGYDMLKISLPLQRQRDAMSLYERVRRGVKNPEGLFLRLREAGGSEKFSVRESLRTRS
jgi:hypothetical protein